MNETVAQVAAQVTEVAQHASGVPFVSVFTVFVLAIFVGYYVVWSVTPALHTPLMAVTNALSGIIVVGAMLQAVKFNGDITATTVLGALAVFQRRVAAMITTKALPKNTSAPRVKVNKITVREASRAADKKILSGIRMFFQEWSRYPAT